MIIAIKKKVYKVYKLPRSIEMKNKSYFDNKHLESKQFYILDK